MIEIEYPMLLSLWSILSKSSHSIQNVHNEIKNYVITSKEDGKMKLCYFMPLICIENYGNYMITKVNHEVKMWVMTSNCTSLCQVARHGVKEYAMMSKSKFSRRNVRHDVNNCILHKKYIWHEIRPDVTKHVMSKGTSWHQKRLVASTLICHTQFVFAWVFCHLYHVLMIINFVLWPWPIPVIFINNADILVDNTRLSPYTILSQSGHI